MADTILVTELIIDSSQMVTGADEAVAQLDRVSVASVRAAAAVDAVSTSLGRAASTPAAAPVAAPVAAPAAAAGAVATGAAAVEAALIRQSNAVEGSAGAITLLGQTSRELQIAQAALQAQITNGTIDFQVGNTEMAAFAARQAEVTAATNALATGQMTLSEAMIAYPGIVRAAGTEAAAYAATHLKTVAALEAFKTGQADVGAVLQRFPGLIGATSASLKEYQTAHASAVATIDKFIASGMNASQFLNRYPELVAQSGAATDSMATKHANLAAQLDHFKSMQMDSNQIVAMLPGLMAAAGSSVAQTERSVTQLEQAFKLFAAGGINAEQLIARLPQLATQAGTAALNMATRLATVGPISRSIGSEVEDAGKKIENAWGRGGVAAEGMVTVHETIAGRWRQLISSMMIELQNFGLMQSIVAGLTNPLVLAIGALVGVFIAAGLRLIEVTANMRQFTAAIQLTNSIGQVTAAGLQGIVDGLRSMGVSAAEAFKSVHELSLNPFINPLAIQSITAVAAKLSAINTGGFDKTSEYVTKLEAAMKGGADTMVKFGVEIGAISGEQAHNIEEMQRHEGSIKAVDAAFQLIKGHVDAIKSPLSGAHEEVTKLGDAWRHLLDTIKDSSIFDSMKIVATSVLDVLTALITKIDQAQTLINKIPGGSPQNTLGLRQYIDPVIKSITGAYALGGGGAPEPLAPGAEPPSTDATKAQTDATKAGTDAIKKLTDVIENKATGATLTLGPGGVPISGSAPALSGAGAETTKTMGDYIVNQLKLSTTQAAAIIGQAVQESSLDPLAGKGSAHQGLFQWDASRFQSLQEFAQSIGTTWQDWRTQVQFFIKEVGQRTPEFLSAGQTLDKMTAMLTRKVEIPVSMSTPPTQDQTARMQAEVENRQGNAQRALATLEPSVAGGATFAQGTEYIKNQETELARLKEGYGLTGLAQEKYQAGLAAEAAAQGKVADKDQLAQVIKNAEQAVLDKNAAAEDRLTKVREAGIKTQLDAVAASRLDEAAGIAAEAEGKAREAEIQRTTTVTRAGATARSAAYAQESDVFRQAAQELESKATTDLKSAQFSVSAMDTQIAANQRLAIATGQSAAAGKQADIENRAAAMTHNAAATATAAHMEAEKDLAAAISSGDAKRVAQAQQLVSETQKTMEAAAATRDLAVAKLTIDAAYKSAEGLATATNTLKDQVEQETLIISLQGQSTDQINAQVEALKAQQKIKNDIVNLDQAIATATADGDQKLLAQATTAKDILATKTQQYTAEVAIETKVKEQEADAQRAQQRLDSAVKSVADTINSQIGTALDNAFSGQKAQDWGATMKTILNDLLKQIVEFTLIQPAIGTALGALGFAQVAQQFGSFGNLFGGGTNTVSGSGGLLGGLFGSGSVLGGLGQAGSAISGISKLGGLISNGGLFGAGGIFGSSIPSTEALLSAGGAGGIVGSATGVTEASTALSSAGVESAVSAAAPGILGSLGSVLPFVGIAAGAASLISGLFGNKKPSNNASGALIDLSTGGVVSGFRSGGVAANDQAVNQITDSVSKFTNQIITLSNAASPGINAQVGGTIAVQAGTRDGIKIDYSGPMGTFQSRAQDAATAINDIELQIAQNLTGVGDTLKTVLAHISDPSQLQAAVTFAQTYDNLKTAAASAFSSISTDTGAIGQFTTALQSINTTFQGLATQASQFGLSLDPINAGLKEATTRLQTDFGAALDQAIGNAGGSSYISALTTVAQTFATNTRDAISIGLGGDQATIDKIAQVEQVQALATLGTLTATQLQDVATKFATTNPEITAMAQALIAAGSAAQGTAGAVVDLTSGLKSVTDLITNLRSGQLSGLTPAAQTTALTGAFNAALRTQQTAPTAQGLTDLSTAASNAIQASQTAYGEGPQTAALRTQIINALSLLVTTTPASLASLAAGSLSASSPVRMAQAAAALRAGAGTTSIVQGGFAEGTQSTPAGAILVGERGPELIFQGGGASVVPISQHSAYQWRGPSFAGGTGDVPALLQALLNENMALRKQIQGGQIQASNDARQVAANTAATVRKLGSGIRTAQRQRVA